MPEYVISVTSKTITPESINKFLRSWSLEYRNLVKEAFDNQGWQPNSWAPRMVPNIAGILNFLDKQNRAGNLPKRFFENRPALVDEGNLKNSFTVSEPTESSVTVGTSKPYVRNQQYGLVSVIPITSKIKENILILIREGKYKFLRKYLKQSSFTIKPHPRTIFGWNNKCDEVLADTINKNLLSGG